MKMIFRTAMLFGIMMAINGNSSTQAITITPESIASSKTAVVPVGWENQVDRPLLWRYRNNLPQSWGDRGWRHNRDSYGPFRQEPGLTIRIF